MMTVVRIGAGVRTVTLKGVTYNLNQMDRIQVKTLRQAVVNAWERSE